MAYRAALEETRAGTAQLGRDAEFSGSRPHWAWASGRATRNAWKRRWRPTGAALEEYTRESVPLAWALTQNDLGDALRILGELEGGTERLEEAAAAYRAALEEYTRQPSQLESSRRTQNNLDSVLHRLSERLADPGDAAGLGFGTPPGWAADLAC